MRTMSAIASLVCLSLLVMLGGCGGGSSSTTATASKSTARLSTEGRLPQGTQLSGINVLITLPAGVTVDTEANGDVSAGVVTVSGVAAQTGNFTMTAPIYTPATATAAGTLQFTLAASNFGTGEFATVKFNVA